MTYLDKTSQIMEGVETIIKQYIPYFVAVYEGHRPIGSPGVTFPCVMMEPNTGTEELITTSKVENKNRFTIYFYIVNNGRDGLVRLQGQAMNALLKLFSNNALGDLQTATPSHKFLRWYESGAQYWIEARVLSYEYSPTFSFFLPGKEQFCRAGKLNIEFTDRFVR